MTVDFMDGSVEMTDVVIDADGFRSVARRCTYFQQPVYSHISTSKSPFSLSFHLLLLQLIQDSGLTGVGGFIPLSGLASGLLSSLNTKGVTMTFGPHSFFTGTPPSLLRHPHPTTTCISNSGPSTDHPRPLHDPSPIPPSAISSSRTRLLEITL